MKTMDIWFLLCYKFIFGLQIRNDNKTWIEYEIMKDIIHKLYHDVFK
jgi:hypothetical protein